MGNLGVGVLRQLATLGAGIAGLGSVTDSAGQINGFRAVVHSDLEHTLLPRTCAKSQDVHTPRVIASDFVASDACGFILPPSAWRRPETLPMMDEVDGRPGAVALQSGHLDAHSGVPATPLSLPHSTPRSTVIPSTQLPRLFSGADQPKAACPTAGGLHHRRWLAPPQVVGEHHENLPGK
jgi:hypothetical protein